MSDFSRIHVIHLFLVVFHDFQMHLTLCQIDRFFRFLSQIKVLFFYFNRFFVKYLLSFLRACHWLIISDSFSSIFPMLNSHKKNRFCSKKVSPSRFWLNTRVFVYFIRIKWEKPCRKSVPSKKFLIFWDGDKCYCFWDFLIYILYIASNHAIFNSCLRYQYAFQ